MNLKEKVAKKIQLARKNLGMTQSELASLCGYSRGRLSNWEGATRMPSAQEIHKIANALKVSPAWLFCVTDNVAEYETNTGQLLLVPILTLEDLLNINLIESIDEPKTQAELLKKFNTLGICINNETNYSKKTFGLKITDNSMSPEICEKDLIIIDPTITPLPGKYVLASFERTRPMLRKYRKQNNESIELISINSDWPNQTYKTKDKKLVILGTAVELRRNFYY